MSSIPFHYPHATRSLLELFQEGALSNVAGVLIEPDYGYIARISYTNGKHRIIHGSDLGLNTSAANELADDKGHTKFVLRNIGINCPGGEEFLLPWWAAVISGNTRLRNKNMRTTDEAAAYIKHELGYPVYIKPVNSSKGAHVYKIDTEAELQAVLRTYADERIRVAVIEEPIPMPDYRLVTLDGELISAYKRNPLMVTGDGQATISKLLEARRISLEGDGRNVRIDPADPRLLAILKKNGQDMQFIPPDGTQIVLADISNLSAGGSSEDVTDIVADKWKNVAATIAGNFNLRLCGIDLACTDIASNTADYSVLEVNASPGLDHFAASGTAQNEVVRDIYIKAFNALPS